MEQKRELSQAERILFFSQDYLLTSMQSLGYTFQDIGVCKGVAHRGVKAFHSNKFDYYCNLLSQIQTIFKEEKGKCIANLKQNSTVLDIEKLFILLKESIRQRIEALPTDDKEEINKIFFDIQKQYEHNETDSYFQDYGFQKEGIIRGYEEGGCSPYSLKEIAEFFNSIQALNKRISFALCGGYSHHSIALFYDPDIELWTVIDANPPIITPCKTVEELADKIVRALNFNTIDPKECHFRSYLYYSQDEPEFETVIRNWIQDREIIFVKNEIFSMYYEENPYAQLAFNRLKELATDIKNKNLLLELKYAFDISGREQSLEFYKQNKFKPQEVLDTIRYTLDLTYKTFANASTCENFLEIRKRMNIKIDQAFNGPPSSSKTITPSLTFFKSNYETILSASVPLIVSALGIYLFWTNHPIDENELTNKLNLNFND
jgi:hypothetical protein